MINNLKTFKKVLQEINVLIKEKEVNNLILQEFGNTISDINNQISLSNNNIEKLEKDKNRLNNLEKKQEAYRIKGWIYTFLPTLFALIFSPIIFNVLPITQACIILCILSLTLSVITSIIGFEEYNIIKNELKKLPKIKNELQLEYKNNDNLKYDLSFYTYKDIEIKKEQKIILENIQNLLEKYEKEKNEKQTIEENNIYSKLVSNKIKIKK